MRILAIALCSAGLAACSTTPPPQIAYDRSINFSRYKTFDWYADPSEEKSVGGAIVDARWVNDHVKAAITAELANKGIRAADSAPPDFYVDYHTRSGGIAERDQYGVYSWWTGMPTGTNYYKQAVLILDVRDPQKKLVWRGAETKVLGTDPEQLDRQVKSAVATLFKNFPPGAAPAS
jgi:uncharacterized protein DUF4136